jgi:serine/threonine protein kinase
LELLQVFRDTIKCHRSLYQNAKILHQDVSPGNIIILDGATEKPQKWMLIDLDAAINLNGESDGEYSIVGTRRFMTFGVLKSETHTYRHDLESLLYVFLWTIITNVTGNPPKTSRVRAWYHGSFVELAERKRVDMEETSFLDILNDFTPELESLKPLAERLRVILFPSRDEVLWTGTDDTPEAVDRLYEDMIHAFQDVIVADNEK